MLAKFQNGYSKRDITLKDSFVDELFWDDNDTLVVGTGDIDGAIVSSYVDVAWITTEAVLKRELNVTKMYDNCVKNIRENLDHELEAKNKLIRTLKSISSCLNEETLGKEVIRPVRFSAILVNKNGTWKFHNIHFSYPVVPPTDIRIIEDYKIC